MLFILLAHKGSVQCSVSALFSRPTIAIYITHMVLDMDVLDMDAWLNKGISVSQLFISETIAVWHTHILIVFIGTFLVLVFSFQ